MRGINCILTLLLLSLPSPVMATVLMEFPLKDLATRSSLIVQGRVVGMEFVKGVEGRIFTIVDVVVEREHRAGLRKRGDLLRVRLLGGEFGGYKQVIAGNPSFEMGEEVLLFLIEEEGYAHVTGMKQGKFRILRDGGALFAERDLRGVGFLRRMEDGGFERTGPRGVERVALDDLLSRIGDELRSKCRAAFPGCQKGGNR